MRIDVCLSLSRTISVFGCRFFLIANATRKSALGKAEGHSEPCGKDERLQSHRNDCSATLSRDCVCVCVCVYLERQGEGAQVLANVRAHPFDYLRATRSPFLFLWDSRQGGRPPMQNVAETHWGDAS